MRLSEAQYRALLARSAGESAPAPGRPHKYRARPLRSASGERYDSTFEARRHAELLLAERAGEIRRLGRQRRIRLTDSRGRPYLIRSTRYRNGRAVTYVADFYYEERAPDGTWRTVIEDAKGADTPASRLKRAIVERMTGAPVRIVHARRPRAGRRSRKRRRLAKLLQHHAREGRDHGLQ